ncbi:YqaI family protein [Bacillus sp. FSL M7-0996]|uniref:YqaI family protein n=1 Tax=Bacillus sp. FSL M7-0996 TaxID=2921538 RepID=UPI00403FD028
MKQVTDHPVEDFYGVEIRKDDTYYIFGQDTVLEHNLKMYLIEKYKVPCFQAQ